MLEAQGHEVAIFNGDLYGSEPRCGESTLTNQGKPDGEHRAYERLRAVLRQVRPEAVGITGMTAEFPSVSVAAQIVRAEDASVPVVVGGVHPTLVPEEVLEYKCFDYVVFGEGEEPAAALFAMLASGGNPETVAGIAYWRAGAVTRTAKRPLIEDLDGLPLPPHRGLIDRDFHIPADLGGGHHQPRLSLPLPVLCQQEALDEAGADPFRFPGSGRNSRPLPGGGAAFPLPRRYFHHQDRPGHGLLRRDEKFFRRSLELRYQG